MYYCVVALPRKFAEAINPGDLGGTTRLYTGIGERSFT